MAEAEIMLVTSEITGVGLDPSKAFACRMVRSVRWDEKVAGPVPPLMRDVDEIGEKYLLIVNDEAGVIVKVDFDFNVEWVGDKERAMRALCVLQAGAERERKQETLRLRDAALRGNS